MSASQATSFNTALFEDRLGKSCAEALAAFKHITRWYAFFHIFFFTLGLTEVLSFLLFFSFFTKTSILAFSLAGLFLTTFSYFVLLFYFQAKKPEQLSQLRAFYLKICKETVPFQPATPEYHLALVHAIYRLVHDLQYQEYQYYSLPKFFESLRPVIEKFSVWTHWKDVHQMKEILLFVAIQELIDLIKSRPTDLEAHASLANAYLMLSKLYKAPEERPNSWIPPEYFSAPMQEKFRNAANFAIEEFRILDHYAPEDPWVYAQLAAIYHDLHLPEEEIRAYETLLKISPDDKEVLFRLGVLYFEQGQNAKALQIYDLLKGTKADKAEALISHYGSFLKISI